MKPFHDIMVLGIKFNNWMMFNRHILVTIMRRKWHNLQPKIMRPSCTMCCLKLTSEVRFTTLMGKMCLLFVNPLMSKYKIFYHIGHVLFDTLLSYYLTMAKPFMNGGWWKHLPMKKKYCQKYFLSNLCIFKLSSNQYLKGFS